MKPLSVPSQPQFHWYKTVRRYRSRKLWTVLFRWYNANTSLVAFDMMTRTWHFVTMKITNGVNKLFSCFFLILNRCVWIIFTKISLATSHGAFSAGLDFTAGNTHVEKSTNQQRAFTLSPVSWFSEQRKSKTPDWRVRGCLTRERMQK